MPWTEEELHEFKIKKFVRQFEEWKPVLQGERVWDYPIDIVPPCPPNFFSLPEPIELPEVPPNPVHDFFLGLGVAKPFPNSPPRFEAFEFPKPLQVQPIDAVELQLQFPQDSEISGKQWSYVLWNLGECGPISFEMVAAQSRVVFQFVCDETMRRKARSIIAEHLPEVIIREERGYLTKWFCKALATHPKTDAIHEYGLAHDFLVPIPTWQPHEPDPLEPVIDMLRRLEPDECGSYQMVFVPVPSGLHNGLGLLVHRDIPVPFARVFPKCTRGPAKQKLSRPMLAVCVRVMVCARSREATRNHLLALDLCFQSRLESGGNFLSRFVYPKREHGIWYDHSGDQENLVKRLYRRTGMLLSRDEVLALAHLPFSRAQDPKVRIILQNTKPVAVRHRAPLDGTTDGILLGINTHHDEPCGVLLKPEERSRHTYIIGGTGMGKSTLILGMILQDIANGAGVAVLDPHGDLIEKVLAYLPEKRKNDVILFDPSDMEYPIGFNILAAHSEEEKLMLASDLVAVFRRLSTAWGDQMHAVLTNAIIAFLESSRGGTLVDLCDFLVDKEYRRRFLETVNDGRVRSYWTKEFPLLTGKPQGPILTRLDAFLRSKNIRNMVSQKENKLDFFQLMNQKKIFLAKLTHGAITPENSYLLGSLLVAKFQQAAFARHAMPQSERSLFNLYIDEFHDFVTPSVAAILSGGRKYGLGLTLAHQELRQLWSRDEQVASAVLELPATRICFHAGDWDAKKLAEGFSFFTAKDIQNLDQGEAICRIDTADNDFKITTIPWEKYLGKPPNKDERRKYVLAHSREQYASRWTPKVEAPPAQPEANPAKAPSSSSPLGPPQAVPDEKPMPKAKIHDRKKSPHDSRDVIPEEGGLLQRDIRNRFEREAKKYGYIIEVEKAVLDATGRIDLVLTRGGKRIACEISATTTAKHELGNALKCLSGDYEIVALVSPHRNTLVHLRELSTGIEESARAKLRFFDPDEFLAFLKEQAVADISSESSFNKEHNVKVNYKALPPGQSKDKEKNITQIIAKALKRIQGE